MVPQPVNYALIHSATHFMSTSHSYLINSSRVLGANIFFMFVSIPCFCGQRSDGRLREFVILAQPFPSNVSFWATVGDATLRSMDYARFRLLHESQWLDSGCLCGLVYWARSSATHSCIITSGRGGRFAIDIVVYHSQMPCECMPLWQPSTIATNTNTN